MPISYSELAQLTCPACGKDFEADVWALVDAAERPDLAEALRDDTLDQVVCPHCGHAGSSGAPLLFHDPERRRVYFAAPADVPEHAWHERAQELLYLLVGSLPEAACLPYLGDVQVEQEVAGVRRAWLRRSRGPAPQPRAAAAPEPATYHAPSVEAEPDPEVGVTPAEPPSEMVDAVQNLLAADTPAEFEQVVQRYPVLLTEAAHMMIMRLADEAFAQGQREIGEALRAVRGSLLGIQLAAPADAEVAPVVVAVAEHLHAHAAPTPSALSDAAYQALMQATTTDALQQAVRDYPILLEPWVDRELATRAENMLSENNERVAVEIEERREALLDLRAALSGEAAMLKAIETLLAADNEDDLAQAISDYPILLTDAAQRALTVLEADARARGDAAMAEYAVECRTLLQNVRAQLPQ
jgi:hypothetical protein